MTTAHVTTRTLVAVDLTESDEHGRLWRTLRTATGFPPDIGPGLPACGLATAAGHWFSETDERPEADALCVEVSPPGPPEARPRGRISAPPIPLDHRQFPRIFLSPKLSRRLSPLLADGLTLEIGRNRARVGVDPSAWTSVAAPTLLTISVCWRLLQIVRVLDEQADWIRGAGRLPSGPWSLLDPRRRRELDDHLGTLRRLVIDLPCFEGPLIDPGGYFPSRRSARLFRVLMNRLELDDWRSLIDDRIEILEGTLGAMLEDRRHGMALTCEVVLEVLILIALATDIALSRFPAVLGLS
jgi:hypothetical protein